MIHLQAEPTCVPTTSESDCSSKTVTSTEESHVEVEPIEPRGKITRQSVAEAINKALPKRNAHVLLEKCIICGRDASWFSLDKVWSF
jgi:hypothetical protein